MSYKLDIFAVLRELSKGNTEYFLALPEEEKKSISMYVLMLWVRGIAKDNNFHTILLNEYVNPFVFHLQKDPALLWGLLCVAAEEPYARFNWTKKPKLDTRPNTTKLLMAYYGYPELHARETLVLLQDSDILEVAADLGYDKAELDKIKKEMC